MTIELLIKITNVDRALNKSNISTYMDLFTYLQKMRRGGPTSSWFMEIKDLTISKKNYIRYLVKHSEGKK